MAHGCRIAQRMDVVNDLFLTYMRMRPKAARMESTVSLNNCCGFVVFHTSNRDGKSTILCSRKKSGSDNPGSLALSGTRIRRSHAEKREAWFRVWAYGEPVSNVADHVLGCGPLWVTHLSPLTVPHPAPRM